MADVNLRTQLNRLTALHELHGSFEFGRQKAMQDHYYHQLCNFKAKELFVELTTAADINRVLVIRLPTPSDDGVSILPIERTLNSPDVLGLNINDALVLQALCLQRR